MELLVNAFGERSADSFDAREIIDTGSDHPLKSTEMLQQTLTATRAHGEALNQPSCRTRLTAPCPVASDRKAMRLVPYLLDEM